MHLDQSKFPCIMILVLFAASCASHRIDIRTIPDPRITKEYKELLAKGAAIDWADCPSVSFKAGRPLAHDSLAASMEPDQEQIMQNLAQCLMIVMRTDKMHAEINGFADQAECRPQECISLSKRRAKMIYSEILRMHFPAHKIKCVAWHGSEYPLSTEASGEDRVRNRRVEITWAGLGCKV